MCRQLVDDPGQVLQSMVQICGQEFDAIQIPGVG
jgi:hypothetical protein